MKELRQAKGLTQAELGRAAGVGKSAISQYENGAREPDSAVLLNLARCLDTTTDWLLGRDIGDGLSVREPLPEYGLASEDDPGWRGYLSELHAQLTAIRSAEDRHAVLEMARFLARKDSAPVPRRRAKRGPRDPKPRSE
ncbi:MAG: helix-turn-helix domain-containing protein [Bacteroidota bacterium]